MNANLTFKEPTFTDPALNRGDSPLKFSSTIVGDAAHRDFIVGFSCTELIAADIGDKLDGDYVKIYITPYKHRLSEEDLEYSYGDYNVEIIYSGDSHYNSIKCSTAFIVDTNIVLSAPDVTKYYGGPERFVVTVNDYKGNPLANYACNQNHDRMGSYRNNCCLMCNTPKP